MGWARLSGECLPLILADLASTLNGTQTQCSEWHRPGFGKQRQESQKFKATLGYGVTWLAGSSHPPERKNYDGYSMMPHARVCQEKEAREKHRLPPNSLRSILGTDNRGSYTKVSGLQYMKFPVVLPAEGQPRFQETVKTQKL